MEDASRLQLPPHHPRQGADGGLVDVRDPEGGGIQLVAGAQGADDGNAQVVGMGNEAELTGDKINGVYNIIIGPGPGNPGGCPAPGLP